MSDNTGGYITSTEPAHVYGPESVMACERYERAFWLCDGCQQAGTVKHLHDTDVMTVLYLINDAHKNVSPQCESHSQISVLNIPALLKDLPDWSVDKLTSLIKQVALKP